MGLFTKKAADDTEATAAVPSQATDPTTLDIPAEAIVTDEVDEASASAEQQTETGAWLDAAEPVDFKGPRRSLFFVLRRTIKGFIKDQSFDMAAALTYYSIFAIFPALIALFSMIGMVGNPEQVIRRIDEVLEPLVRPTTLDRVNNVLQGVTSSEAAGMGVVVGIVLALWSASAYTNAFRRMMNRLYHVEEGRAIWKLRPMMLLVTLASLSLVTVSLLLMIITGPITKAVGRALGLGPRAAMLWDLLKLPVLLVIVVVVVAVLYQTTPNVKLSRFRIISVGAVVAIAAIIVASAGLAFYVRNFATYNKVYGSLAGVIVFLLWTWVINMSLLFGAKLDSELERGRQLQDGLPAEENLQSPLRDDKAIAKATKAWEKIHAKDRSVRENTHGAGDLSDRPFTKSR